MIACNTLVNNDEYTHCRYHSGLLQEMLDELLNRVLHRLLPRLFLWECVVVGKFYA